MSERPSHPLPAVLPPRRATGAGGRPLPPSLRRTRARPRRRQLLLRAALRALLTRPTESARDAEWAVARIMAHVRRLG